MTPSAPHRGRGETGALYRVRELRGTLRGKNEERWVGGQQIARPPPIGERVFPQGVQRDVREAPETERDVLPRAPVKSEQRQRHDGPEHRQCGASEEPELGERVLGGKSVEVPGRVPAGDQLSVAPEREDDPKKTASARPTEKRPRPPERTRDTRSAGITSTLVGLMPNENPSTAPLVRSRACSARTNASKANVVAAMSLMSCVLPQTTMGEVAQTAANAERDRGTAPPTNGLEEEHDAERPQERAHPKLGTDEPRDRQEHREARGHERNELATDEIVAKGDDRRKRGRVEPPVEADILASKRERIRKVRPRIAASRMPSGKEPVRAEGHHDAEGERDAHRPWPTAERQTD